MRKLADAEVKDIVQKGHHLSFTADNNAIYYIDSSGSCVYKIDISSGKKSSYFDISDLCLKKTEKQDVEVEEEVTDTVETDEYDEVEEEIEEEVTETVVDEETGEEKEVTKTVVKTVTKKIPKTEEVTKTVTKTVSKDVVVAEYTDFIPTQIVYDNVTKQLILQGYFSKVEEPFKGVSKGNYYMLYDITDKRDDILLKGATILECNYIGSYGNGFACFLLDSYNFYYYPNINLKTGKYDYDDRKYGYHMPGSLIKSGNDFYVFSGVYYREGYIDKYDYNDAVFKSINSKCSYTSVGVKGKCYYFWNDNKFRKIDVSDGKVTELPINTLSENVEFEDMGAITNLSDRMMVIDDNTYIFYDKDMQAFRKLSKNK